MNSKRNCLTMGRGTITHYSKLESQRGGKNES